MSTVKNCLRVRTPPLDFVDFTFVHTWGLRTHFLMGTLLGAWQLKLQELQPINPLSKLALHLADLMRPEGIELFDPCLTYELQC